MPRFSLPKRPDGDRPSRAAHFQLGRLEREVMDVIWTSGDADASTVHAAVAGRRLISLSTIQSTLERLHRKHLLRRHKRGRAYAYAPALTREELIGDLVSDVIKGLSPASNEPGLCGLADQSDRVDEATLQRLEAWIAAHRARALTDS